MSSTLWLGAHKTGTTFLQKSLDLSTSTLTEHGITYTELEQFRDMYARPLLNADHPDPPAPPVYAPEPNRNLIFDENIPGYVQHALSTKGFYPEMIARSAAIVNYLRLDVDDIVFGVRSYDSYLPSLYCETLKSTPFRTFDRYLSWSFRAKPRNRLVAPDHIDRSEVTFDRMNWHSLVRRLADAYPGARVRVYFYEHLRGNESQLLSNVCAVPAEAITLLTTLERKGFSGRAVEELHELASERQVERRDVRKAVRRFPSGSEFPSYYPWTDDERATLLRNYQNDSNQLRADDRIEIIELG